MTFQSLNPATGQLLESFPVMPDGDIETVISTARQAFETQWRKTPIRERAVIMARVEVALVASIFEYYSKNTEAHIRSRPFRT
jgi:succinate-semialdehyde dehydrogenase / glutarate-semialdehyde dehydrogenase